MASANQFNGLRWRLAALCVVLLLLLAMALLWSSGPVKQWLSFDQVVLRIQQFGGRFGPAAAIAGFTLAVALAVPLSFMALVAVIAFGPWSGCACTLAGALLGASLSYALGRFLGYSAMQQLAGPRLNALSRKLGSRGVLAVVAVRLLPVAPFAVVNMVAGASHLRLRDLLLGTVIGITPMTLAMMLFTPHMVAAVKQPGSATLGLLAITVGVIGVGAWAVRRWFRNMR